ncbi:HAD-IIIC family phosphatase [Tanticharoenia sakaeratensis]|uniref:HAD-IIIC family phosphatase n=1 Tax=Tanticharoenia sakaeratensis TaxID=444053 RepID=UPI000A470C29|nr:HAD-IIIC family phosphatase [Tanticharoenia sakaeratensis]
MLETDKFLVRWTLPEAVRLVIWDLDETFWKGTLSEEGISDYISENHDIIVTLAERGIMSSICSKNDFEQVKDILEEKELWDYFIFPSINWESKGPRVKEIIELVQLRPASIMFIDDNPGNRGEVARYCPDVQIENEHFVEKMLDDPRFAGKEDFDLSRLNQYKVLEKKSSDKQNTGNDNSSFLRQSGIVVEIEHNVEGNIERAVELINRTNQLNFTKNRLPEDHQQAIAELKKQITDLPYARTVGLVKVKDNYGDYGICGFYLCEQIHEWFVLKHFCFSCRILGMGVEHWLYNKIGRPYLHIEGEVLSNPLDDTEVDWINNAASDTGQNDFATAISKVNNIYIRGGCDLDAVGHYLRYVANSIVSDTNIVRDENLIRRDSLTNIYDGLVGLTAEQKETVSALGFDPAYFHADFLKKAKDDDVILLSLAADTTVPTYVPVGTASDDPKFALLMQIRGIFLDLVSTSAETLRENMRHVNWDDELQDRCWNRVEYLRSRFESFQITVPYYRKKLDAVLSQMHSGARMVIILPSFKHRDNSGQIVVNERANAVRQAVLESVKNRRNVRTVDIMSTVDNDADFVDGDHITRQAYFRLYEQVVAAIMHMVENADGEIIEPASEPSDNDEPKSGFFGKFRSKIKLFS